MPTKMRNLTGMAALLVLIGTAVAQAQVHPRGEATLAFAGGTLTVEYGQPPLEGRDVMDLIEPGSLWRMGADQPTTLKTDVPLQIGGTQIASGKHILLARFVGKKQWNLVVSSKSVFDFDESAKIAEAEGKFAEGKDAVDRVTITLEGQGKQGKLILAWGTYRLEAPFRRAN